MKIQKLYVPLEINRIKVQGTELTLKELTSQGWKMEGTVTLMSVLPSFPVKIEVLSKEIK